MSPDAKRRPDQAPSATLSTQPTTTNNTRPVNPDREWEVAAIRSIDHNRRAYYEGRNEAFWLAEYKRSGVA